MNGVQGLATPVFRGLFMVWIILAANPKLQLIVCCIGVFAIRLSQSMVNDLESGIKICPIGL
jgi:hypothetical protein